MGLFDFLRGRNTGGADPLQKHAERVLDKRAMSPDRFASIEYLCNAGTDEAWRALLPRFNFSVDPSITDREEKQFIIEHIAEAGEAAVEPVKEFLRKAQAVNWPIKMLRSLVPQEAFVTELIDVLSGEETAYQKNAERKNQAIIALEDCPDPRVPEAVAPFLDDVSEDTRFHALRTLLAQGDPKSAEGLYALLVRDDSLRIRTNIAEGVAEHAWPCPDELRDKVIAVLPRIPTGPFTLSPEGVLKGPTRRS
jgi:HEAT repeat protein